MKEIIDILNKLSRLDLATFPVAEVNNYLDSLGAVAQIGYTLHPGNLVFRARPHEDINERFDERHKLHYKPQTFNTTFQRASTPNATMFYGSIVPEKMSSQDLDIGRATACFESAHTFRNNWLSSIEKITFSKWEVTEDINLAMIAYSPRFLREGSILTELNREFQESIGEFDPKFLKKALTINEFIGYEFSKPTIRGDFDYMISAIFTEKMIRLGFDGVLYPSVKADGRGYNVCFTTDCTDKKLKLRAAGEGMIIRSGYNTEIINLAQAGINDDSKPFVYEELPQEHTPKEIWNKLLNE